MPGDIRVQVCQDLQSTGASRDNIDRFVVLFFMRQSNMECEIRLKAMVLCDTFLHSYHSKAINSFNSNKFLTMRKSCLLQNWPGQIDDGSKSFLLTKYVWLYSNTSAWSLVCQTEVVWAEILGTRNCSWSETQHKCFLFLMTQILGHSPQEEMMVIWPC